MTGRVAAASAMAFVNACAVWHPSPRATERVAPWQWIFVVGVEIFDFCVFFVFFQFCFFHNSFGLDFGEWSVVK